MKAVFTKKLPFWVDAHSFYTTVANHCNIDIYPVYQMRRFIIFKEYRCLVHGRKSNLNNFEKYANVKYQR
jgi:hypothetical protein